MSETPPTPCTAAWSRRLERVFSGSPSARQLRAVREHATACDACRLLYDKLGRVERALAGHAFPRPAADRVSTLMLANAVRPRRWLWAPASALLAAAAALILWISTGERPVDRAEFRARGTQGEIAVLAPGDRAPGVRIFCVELSEHGARVRDEVHMARGTMPPPQLRCTLGDELQIAYSTPNFSGLSMTVFARSHLGDTWYAPTEAGGSPVSLAQDVIDEPLAWSTRLSADHAVGTYDVAARFFLDLGAPTPARGAPIADLRAKLVIEPAAEVTP